MHNGLNNAPIHIGKPDTHVGTHYQKTCKDQDVKGLLRFVGGDRYLDEFLDSLDEDGVYVSFAALDDLLL